jgi:succinate dehydrogenase / fumarate reductase cytochrome b subunit
MSVIAVNVPAGRLSRFYEASVGKKAVMAATGVVLFGYVVGHLLGNLQIFSSDHEQINRYARFLHSSAALLWGVRLLLAACVGLHIVTSVQLWLLKRRARPIRYHRKDDVGGDYASRTMMWSGPIIAAFVVFHLLHLTAGKAPGLPLDPENVYENVIRGFRHLWVSVAYIVAIALLMTHLYHGVWSMFQSVGASHPRYTPVLRRLARMVALALAAGYISIPVWVMVRFGVQ